MGHYVTDMPKAQMRRYAKQWDGLPLPRLQLRWSPKPVPQSDKKVAADARLGRRMAEAMGVPYQPAQTWECFYELVMPVGQYDIRNEHYYAGFILIPISATRRSGSATNPPCKFGPDTPYRDGSHAYWDAKALGWLPIYVIDPAGVATRKVDYHDAPAEWSEFSGEAV